MGKLFESPFRQGAAMAAAFFLAVMTALGGIGAAHIALQNTMIAKLEGELSTSEDFSAKYHDGVVESKELKLRNAQLSTTLEATEKTLVTLRAEKWE